MQRDDQVGYAHGTHDGEHDGTADGVSGEIGAPGVIGVDVEVGDIAGTRAQRRVEAGEEGMARPGGGGRFGHGGP